jgi:hypothetical protein
VALQAIWELFHRKVIFYMQLLPNFGMASAEQAVLHRCNPGKMAFMEKTILKFTFAGYEEEARYFESGVRSSKRQELASRAADELKTAFKKQLVLLQQRCIDIAKEALSQAESDSSQFLSLAKM